MIHFSQRGKVWKKFLLLEDEEMGRLNPEDSSNLDSREESHSLEESDKDVSEAISINLTPEQYDLVKSNRYVKYFLNGDSTGVSLDIHKHTEGQIIFNFQFKKVDIVRMLKAKHVCQMLQISNGLLMSLVKAKKIRSYRLGRLRRFLLQDVLDYLSRSEELTESSEL
jgi:excisionase family DNA binding protein